MDSSCICMCTYVGARARTRTRAHKTITKEEITNWEEGREGPELGKRKEWWAVTLIWLHIHVWSGTVVSHRLPLTHCHLVLHRHALGWWHGMVVTSHGAMATWRHIHGTVCHVELIGSRSLHWHMVRPFEEKWSERKMSSRDARHKSFSLL